MRTFFLSWIFFFLVNLSLSGQKLLPNREKMLMDFGWKFAFGHPYDTRKDFNNGTGYFSYLAKAGYGDGAASPNFDDRAWRTLDLPHDWAVEQPFHPDASYSHGYKAIGRKFPESSVGWYRKNFLIPSSDTGRKISIILDGVFRNSTVWVNGHFLGTEKSGYNQIQYDISDILNYGGNNTIAVRVDATMEEGWFYEGAGIYRHIWLLKTSPIHISLNGTFVISDVKGSEASVTAKVDIVNEGNENKSIDIIQTILDAEGKTVSTGNATNVSIVPFQTKEVSIPLVVSNPKLWDIDAPYLYKLSTKIVENSEPIDSYETSFGIRTIRFDAKEGFFLNGKNVKLKGSNNHQDHAGVGTAMPDELQNWRIKTLKTMGCNAYRCSHNPPAPELLDACDRLGMLVIDENRLMRTTEDGLKDLKKMILRDRNHPSIICWSLGNEEWAIENNTTGELIAVTLQSFAKSLDPTRSTTVAVSGGFKSGISSVAEVMGYNYLGNGDIEAHYKRFPAKPGMGTEEGSTFATRGVYTTNNEKHYRAAYDQKPRPSFYTIEEGWKFYASRPNLAGMFLWTGFDYRGEPTPYGWPSVTSYFGMMDLCGFAKDNVFYLKSWWSNEPTLHILPHWTWPGQEGKPIDVWVYSNCDEVELFLNKKSLGKKKMEQNGHLEWKVNYVEGALEAIGYKEGKKLLTKITETSKEPSTITMTPHKTSLTGDGKDIAVISVNVLDKNNLSVPVADNEITFSIKGPGKIIGVGNGNPTSLEKDKFIESIEMIEIEGLKEKEVSALDAVNEIVSDSNDSKWRPAFVERDYTKLAPAYAYRGTFTLPVNFSTLKTTYFHKCIGNIQDVYVNGKKIADRLKEGEIEEGFLLDKSILRAGKNVITIVGTAIPKKHEWDVPNRDPGLIQLITSEEASKRKLFNGLAQVIVQATKEAGEITLIATSPNLKSSTIKLNVNRAPINLSVE